MTGDRHAPKQLGPVVARELEALPPAERLPFLAVVEQRAKAEGDLQMLRAIKDYKKTLLSLPSTQPPETA